MSIKRTYHTAEFKKKVVLEAIKESTSIELLCKKYSLHPDVIKSWKSEAIEKFDSLFKKESNKTDSLEKEKELLYAKIGQLNIEVDFLKKRL